MMSPRLSVARTLLASARWAEARLLDAPRSASVSLRRISAYSMKSPRSQVTCLARSSAASLRRRSLPGQADDAAVGLELGEARLKEGGRPLRGRRGRSG